MKLTRFGLLAAVILLTAACSDAGRYITVEGFAQGGTWHLICRLPQGVRPQQVKATADSLLLEIDRSVSGYNRGSLLSRLNAGEVLPLDRHFIANFEMSRKVWEISGGAFDPSAAPLFDLWGFGFTGEETVSERAVDSIMAFVGMDHFSLEQRDGKTFLLRDDPRCKLNFNAIAQGYSCDCIASALEGLGCRDYLVEVGREIVCKGLSSRGGKWRIALEKPVDGAEEGNGQIQETLELTDCGIVTSGNYRKFYEKDGKKYAHTIDPHTGRPVTHNLLSATVILSNAPSSVIPGPDPSVMPGPDRASPASPLASYADAYATWMMVIGGDAARAAADTLPGVEVILIGE
ncbi:MAG: FAD:protein FMN transferase [Bacteroidales bacterium]|nr:FAD:protein FMN transferase [Bacteroidales bacterium]